jgi:preprotein translocase subunit SecA
MSATSVLPTRDMAFAAYPQRDVDTAWPALRDAARWLRAALQGGSVARLPARTEAALAAARRRLMRLDDVKLQALLPKLRAQLRRSGLRSDAAGYALAVVAEFAQRRLGLAPYPTQLLAAWLMLEGRFAEMATGEGKTLAAGLGAAAAALAGVPVHLLTANDYLVQRDREKLLPLYEALGLSCACVLPSMVRAEREAAYRCDIVYLTARELAFDYLRDHLLLSGVRDPRLLRALSISQGEPGNDSTDFGALSAMFDLSTRAASLDAIAAPLPVSVSAPSTPFALQGPAPVLPGLCLALIDEADSILLDEATVPLILAAPADAMQTESFERAMTIARTLRRGRDYTVRAAQRRVDLNDDGRAAVSAAVQALPADKGLLRPARRAHELVTAALSACHALQRDRDYTVQDGKLQLIDEVTGRVADGRQWTGPLQAMVELKEGLAPSPATRVSAQITYQRFFPRYLRVGGMSGTLAEARRELRVLYNGRVQRVPLAKADRRQWLGERLFVNTAARDGALVDRVKRCVALGRPVLVGTDSVAASMRLSAGLLAAGIDNQLLNASQDAHEAECIARAGCTGVVTVATNIAGRGTDIVLDAAARAAGGLHVVATMRNRSRRIDRQLIGRAARHGDPGSAERLLSLDDALFTEQISPLWRRLAQCCAPRGVVPRTLAHALAAAAQRRAEWRERALRQHLRRSDEQADGLYAFFGGSE